MADYKVTDTELTSIANAIRARTGSNASLEFPTDFVDELIMGGIPRVGYGDADGAQSQSATQQTIYIAALESASETDQMLIVGCASSTQLQDAAASIGNHPISFFFFFFYEDYGVGYYIDNGNIRSANMTLNTSTGVVTASTGNFIGTYELIAAVFHVPPANNE